MKLKHFSFALLVVAFFTAPVVAHEEATSTEQVATEETDACKTCKKSACVSCDEEVAQPAATEEIAE